MTAPINHHTVALKGGFVSRKSSYGSRWILCVFVALLLLATQSTFAVVSEKGLAKLKKTQGKLAVELQHYFKTGRMADKLVIRGLVKRIDRDIDRLINEGANSKALKEWAQNKSHINRLLKKGRANLGMPRKELNKINIDFARLLATLVDVETTTTNVSQEDELPPDFRFEEEVRFTEEAQTTATTRLGAEQARLAGDALQAKEEARLAEIAKAESESKVSEDARLAAEAKITEQTRTAVVEKVAAEARLAEAAEKVQIAVKAKVVEDVSTEITLTEEKPAEEVAQASVESIIKGGALPKLLVVADADSIAERPTISFWKKIKNQLFFWSKPKKESKVETAEKDTETPDDKGQPIEDVSLLAKIGERFKKERTLKEALAQGDSEFGMRFRFEDLNNGLEQDNSVVTFRSHFSRQTKPYRNFSLYGELEDVRLVGGIDQDSTRVRSGFASVNNDPDTTEINQAFLLFTGFEKVHFSLGRQRIVYGNGRFVGNSHWRQNERTYDSFAIQSDFFKDIVLEYAFIGRVRTTQGGVLEVTDHVFNATYLQPKWGLFNAYGLLLSDDVTQAASVTAGARLQGDQELNDEWQILYAAEIAGQLSATHDVIYTLDLKPSKHAIYSLLEGGAIYKNTTVKGAYEVLRSDEGTYGFDMLLGSENEFNGWTDVFLTIPVKGLRDLNLTGERELFGLQLLGEYHLFSADSDGSAYGREIDLMIAKQFDELNQIGIKLASYQSDGFSSDLSKFWFWFSFRN